MKLIKKIAAIMFAFMMVVSMNCNVKAAETGKITISPANPNEEYKIYTILKLTSFILIQKQEINGMILLIQL